MVAAADGVHYLRGDQRSSKAAAIDAVDVVAAQHEVLQFHFVAPG